MATRDPGARRSKWMIFEALHCQIAVSRIVRKKAQTSNICLLWSLWRPPTWPRRPPARRPEPSPQKPTYLRLWRLRVRRSKLWLGTAVGRTREFDCSALIQPAMLLSTSHTDQSCSKTGTACMILKELELLQHLCILKLSGGHGSCQGGRSKLDREAAWILQFATPDSQRRSPPSL